MRVQLEVPSLQRADEFITAVKCSRKLHKGLTTPPYTRQRYKDWLERFAPDAQEHFLIVIKESGEIAGTVDIGTISRGLFQSAYLGYYAFEPHDGKGYMREGLTLAINFAFRQLKLHRLEANIQTNNKRSIALVQGLGFSKEGFSTRYLKVAGRWRDHERWAILKENWHPGR